MKFKKEKIKGCIFELFMGVIIGGPLILVYIYSPVYVLAGGLVLLLSAMEDTHYVIKKIFGIK